MNGKHSCLACARHMSALELFMNNGQTAPKRVRTAAINPSINRAAKVWKGGKVDGGAHEG